MSGYEAELRAGLRDTGIPQRMHEGICGYVLQGIQNGSFLTAVFSNDLADAAGRADAENQSLLYEYAVFLINYVPIGAWGSLEKVREWKGIEN